MICDVPVVRINVLLNHQCINVYGYTYTDKYSAQEKANDEGYLVSIALIGHCVWIHQISCFICSRKDEVDAKNAIIEIVRLAFLYN